MAKRVKIVPTVIDKSAIKNHKLRPVYRQLKNYDFKLSITDREKAAKLFEMTRDILLHTMIDVDINSCRLLATAQKILGNIEFDIDVSSRKLEAVVNASDIRGGIQKYLKTI